MARRRSGIIENLIVISSRLPWWAGLLLALLAYVGFGFMAGTEIPQASGTGEMPRMVGHRLLATFGMILQYGVPALFAVGAAISAIQSLSNRRMFDRTARSGRLEMDWRDFERLVGELFRRQSFKVEWTGGGGADGGVDLIASDGADRYLVQCKHWRKWKVGVKEARELFGLVAAQGAAGGALVTSGRFTDEARRFADKTGIELIDGAKLREEMAQISKDGWLDAVEAPTQSEAPACPTCQAPMVRRTARRGANEGQPFWGCSRFPSCKTIRPA